MQSIGLSQAESVRNICWAIDLAVQAIKLVLNISEKYNNSFFAKVIHQQIRVTRENYPTAIPHCLGTVDICFTGDDFRDIFEFIRGKKYFQCSWH